MSIDRLNAIRKISADIWPRKRKKWLKEWPILLQPQPIPRPQAIHEITLTHDATHKAEEKPQEKPIWLDYGYAMNQK